MHIAAIGTRPLRISMAVPLEVQLNPNEVGQQVIIDHPGV